MSTKDLSQMGKSEAELRLLVNEEVNNLKKTIKDKDAILENYKKEHGVLESFFREVKEHIDTIKPSPVIYKPKQGKALVDSPCSVVVQICDAHMGAVQKASEIEGFGEYSPEISWERQTGFIEKVLDWVEVQRSAYKIDECVVLVLGDLISGDIQNLNVTNAFPTPIQVVEAAKVLATQVSMLAPHFKKIRCEFLTEDNHSRLTQKPQMKEAGLNSLNYLVGYIAKESTTNLSNLEFNIYPQYEVSVKVQNQRYLICHGHAVTGFGGIPWYGIERKTAKEAIKRMNAPLSSKFDKMILGHWHTPITTPFYWVGGSCSGTDAYDHKFGRQSDPSQPAWLVHPTHKEFNRTDFWL
jgi:hypothetical protein